MSQFTSPFKFLDSYQQEDADIFFGREKETEALYNALSGVKHLLVYGPSGAGKTSLIECGLRNQFSDADWFALTIRRGDDMTASFYDTINDALREKIPLDPVTRRPQAAGFDFGQAIECLFAERYQPVYLLFDQFEELLIQGSKQEKEDFFSSLNRLIRYKVPCRVILIMREEFIGHLSEFEPLCPSIFQHRFRLEKMNRMHVQEVIRQTIEAPKFRPDFQVKDSEQFTLRILDRLPDEKREIELAHVQVFLSELWERAAKVAPAGTIPILSGELIQEDDKLEGILDSFLNTQLRELDPVYGKKTSLEVLAAMISERHTKLQLSAEDIQQDLDDKGIRFTRPLAELLRDLEKRRILRSLKAGEQTRYEISHDVLALVVGQNLTDEMKLREKAREIYRVFSERKGRLSQEDLDYLRPFQPYLAYPPELEQQIAESEAYLAKKQEEEKAAIDKRRRNALITAIVASVLVLAAVLATWYAFGQNVKAENAIQEAANKTKEAKIQKYIADTTSVRAAIDKKIAVQQTELAKIESKKAATAEDLAAKATIQANIKKLEAEKAALSAVEALLEQDREDIRWLRYDKAYDKLKKAAALAASFGADARIMKDSAAYELMEIAFFQHHSGHADLARESFNLAAGLLGKSMLSGKADFDAALQGLNGDRYDFIKRRYVPDLVSLQDGSYKMEDEFETTIKDFKMARTETTVWQYNLFCVAMGHDITQRRGPDGTTVQEDKFQLVWGWIGDHPVVYINWYDAVVYVNWLSKEMGLSPAYEIKTTEKDNLNTNNNDDFRWTVTPIENANGYRLPTEAEWEYAARGGARHDAFAYSGSDTLAKVAWYDDNSDSHPHPVGGKKANGAGLFDMSGNVWEWCFDRYGHLPAETPWGAKSGSSRVLRGGAWYNDGFNCSVSRRNIDSPRSRYYSCGFRLAQDK